MEMKIVFLLWIVGTDKSHEDGAALIKNAERNKFYIFMSGNFFV